MRRIRHLADDMRARITGRRVVTSATIDRDIVCLIQYSMVTDWILDMMCANA